MFLLHDTCFNHISWSLLLLITIFGLYIHTHTHIYILKGMLLEIQGDKTLKESQAAEWRTSILHLGSSFYPLSYGTTIVLGIVHVGFCSTQSHALCCLQNSIQGMESQQTAHCTFTFIEMKLLSWYHRRGGNSSIVAGLPVHGDERQQQCMDLKTKCFNMGLT